VSFAYTGDWRDDPGQQITSDVLRWFAERARYELEQLGRESAPPVAAEAVHGLVEHFTDRAEHYLCWVPDDRFSVRDWDDREGNQVPGAWALRVRFDNDAKAMVAALGATPSPPVTVDDALRSIDDPVYDSAGHYLGVREPWARELLSDTGRARHERATRRLWRVLEHRCRCGRWFRIPKASPPTRSLCDPCVAEWRAKRGKGRSV
jgi:hypothetical protein